MSVWDTYVAREDGKSMHFDILMEDKDRDIKYGRKFLSHKPFPTADISSKKCKFCHMEQVSEAIADIIIKEGYYIVEMENCQ
ncbi:DUF2024 family protein [Arenibacter sp. M-2]|nr:DUF2024 family protein [Arenibacter sp. M-2]MDL5510601.1 DUF2024 family protein [Arenibacter sp. M-2]